MRKLATAAISFSAAIFLSCYLFDAERLVAPAAVFALLGAAAVAARRKWLRPASIALIFFSAGLFLYYISYGSTVCEAEKYDGQTRYIIAEIIDYPVDYGNYCRADVRLQTAGLPDFKAILYDNERNLCGAKPGETVRLTGKISCADRLYGEYSDTYYSKGIYFKISSKGEIETSGKTYDIRLIPVIIRQRLLLAVEKLYSSDTSGFIKALMLGDKSDLYNNESLYVAMSRAGFMHVAAVSGMHIAFLVGMLILIFGRGRRSCLICIGIVWLFVLITGAPPSAIRAAFMQSVLLLAPVLKRENDSITSLSLVLAVLLAVNPMAAASVSLQLSFAATAGLLCCSGKIYGFLTSKLKTKRFRKPVSNLIAAFSSSIGATVFTLPLTALHFDSINVLSLFSNPLCLWAISFCFCGAWLSCAFMPLPMIAKVFASGCSVLAKYVFAVADFFSGIPFAVLYTYTDGSYAWIIGVYALLIIALLHRKRKTAVVITAALTAVASLCFVFLNSAKHYRENDVVSVIDVGQGQAIAAFSGKNTVMIDCGNTSSAENAGMRAGKYLLSCGRDRIDILLLTHLHADHANGVVTLMEMVPVDTIVLPKEDYSDDSLFRAISKSAAKHGTKMQMIDSDSRLSLGSIGMELYRLNYREDENERCIAAKLSVGENDILITADASAAAEKQLCKEHDLRGMEEIIVGHHGSKYSCSDTLLKEVGGKLAVISVGYNTYGHPTEETLERLHKYGYNILRTDRDGTIEIYTGADNGQKEFKNR